MCGYFTSIHRTCCLSYPSLKLLRVYPFAAITIVEFKYMHPQLGQRRKGNELFKKGDLKGALSHYKQAESIVTSISGTSQADQEEVDQNRATVLLNIAAVHMGLKQYATAADYCSRAISIQPGNVKGLIRRAKCRCFMHEYQVRHSDRGMSIICASLRKESTRKRKGAHYQNATFAFLYMVVWRGRELHMIWWRRRLWPQGTRMLRR